MLESFQQDDENEKLRQLLNEQSEVQKLQKQVNEKAKSLQELALTNQQLKTTVLNKLETYQESMAQLDSIEELNKELVKEQAEKCVTKKQLTDLLGQ